METEPLRPLFNENKTAVDKVKKGDNKRLSVERIYQKKTQLEHILLRPDTYIGSVEPVTQQMWVFDEDEGLNNREVTFVPGLYKIFDEILVNAADNKQRDPTMSCIKIVIDPENNSVSVWNNGKGIPVVEHKVEKVYVPALIFGQLLTSSNYDDEQKKVTGGRNGYGAKLCNIFSTKFTVETACREYKKIFKQSWTNNMANTAEPKIKSFDGEDYTCITFQPDLSKFKMQTLDKDIVALMSRRAYDVAGSSKGVKVFLNGKKLPVTGFRSYVDMYVKDKVDETGNSLKIAHEVVNDRWEMCLTMSEKGFQQVSFVNSIATTKGGRHVDYVADQIVTKIIDVVKKKNKGGVAVKPFQVKNHMWLFVNSLIENPTFDSQTKENMTLQSKSFGSKCALSEKFIKAATNCGIVESILNWVKFKAQTQLNKKCSAVKHTKIKGIPKLDDANDAGSKLSNQCTLILTEGDSAKTLAVSGLGVVGRDRFGVFPLRGKLLNVREASHKQIMENAEINNIIKIVGLQYKKNYEDEESLKSLRYGKLMIMTDQDQDGSHIKGLLINFIHHNWPSLLKHSFLEEFITPIIKVSKNKQELSFYSIPEFDEWKNQNDGHKSWKIKYYKGLGTSTAKEAKEYFADMERHRITFKYGGPIDDAAITLAFSKKKVDDRKEWLTNFMENRRQRKLHGLPEEFLYGKSTKYLTYNDFINKELILFSNSDNERSIPSLVDGLKPGQRKVLFTCFKRNDKREVKVAQLAGSVAEMSAYHHGEASLMMTIINLAQNFVGSNNINLLQPIGQFGTRLHGGKDAASPRYIFTMLSTLARLLFPSMDDSVLKFIYDDNQKVEPEWYIPIIPTVLVNGAEGIGTGWSCKIPNYDVREIVGNIHRMLDGEEPQLMLPSYKNFKGMIQELGVNQFIINGEISVLDTTTLEISELPVRTWTQNYKEQVLEPMLNGTEKTPALITDYKEYHTDTTVKFIIKLTEDKLAEAEAAGLHKVFKLQAPLTCNSMVLFDHTGCLRKYETVMDILREFFTLRLRYYGLRKDWLLGMLTAESSRLSNQARFILEKIEGKLVIENKPKKELIQMLVQRGYDSDPVKAWKQTQEKEEAGEMIEEEESEAPTTGPDFNYLLNMPMWYLTKEKKDELCKQRDAKIKELEDLKKKSPSDLWKNDLAVFIEELDRVEEKQREDDAFAIQGKVTKGKSGRPQVKKLQHQETLPSPHGRRVIPRITTAMKAEATKKIKKKIKGEDVAKKMEFGEDEDGQESQENSPENSPEGMSLTERLAKKVKAEPGTKAKETKGKKQMTLQFKPVKKEPRAQIDSDSEFEPEEVIPRVIQPRRATAQVKYVLDSDEEEDAGSNKASDASDIDSDAAFDPCVESDESFEVAKPARKPKAASKNVKKEASLDKEEPAKTKKQSSLKEPELPKALAKKDPSPDKKPEPELPKALTKKDPSPDKKSDSSPTEFIIRVRFLMQYLQNVLAGSIESDGEDPPMSLPRAPTAVPAAKKPAKEKAAKEKPVKAAKEKPAKPAGEKAAPKRQAKKAVSTAAKKDKQPSILEALSKPQTSKSTTAARPVDDSDDDDIAPPKRHVKPSKRKNSDSSSDSDFGPKPKSKTAKKTKAADDSFHIDLTSDSEDVGNAPVRSRTGRAKKPITYLEDSEDDMY
ncbi:PREDICTED: DNA topoisomerase 2-alpha [Nanorana parkeri]|uniref:DNA topoisomerase 2-alpha n=1 Tax=Nanorana parkeri TaxID=125878 RepID=UPI0008540827|nr:PREDICTED: DNA topoisomerase 2-alpha [Nanorana parkeri]